MDILGRSEGPTRGPTADIGAYRARDGSSGAAVAIDIDRPHVGMIVGKRGYGKSYTLGVLAEELATTRGIAPVVIDPMGVFGGLAEGPTPVPATKVSTPTVRADVIPPRQWCQLLDVDPESPVGAAIWAVASDCHSLDGMIQTLRTRDIDPNVTRAAVNHLSLAADWGVFAPDGLTRSELATTEVTILDCAGLPDPAINAICFAVGHALYQGRVDGTMPRLPWLLVDEAHMLFAGAAEQALRTIVTRGRQPGVSLVAATQRPAALPAVATSQADLILAHRLTAGADRQRLEQVSPSYMGGTVTDRLPEAPGEVLIIDDVTEQVHHVAIRERETPHGGTSPRAAGRTSSG